MVEERLVERVAPEEAEALRAMLDCVVDKVMAELGATACLLLRGTGPGEEPAVLAQRGLEAEVVERLGRVLGKWAPKEVIGERRWVALEGEIPGVGKRWEEILGPGFWAAVRLPQEKETVAGLVLVAFAAPCDLEAPLAVAFPYLERAARAVELVGLFQELKRQLQEREALLRVAHALARIGTGEELLSLIVCTAVESIRAAESGVIHLLAADGESLVPVGVSQGTLPRTQRANLRLGVGIAGVALLEGRTIRSDDVTRDPHYVPSTSCPPYRSLLVAPMMLGGSRIGTLSLQSSRPAAFTERDEQLLAILAGQAAIVVENDRLLRELRQRLEELRQAQAWLVRSEKLAATGRLAASIAHEINNPLEGIKNFLAVLEERLAGDDANREIVRLIGVGFQRIQKTTQQLLSFSRKHEVARRPCSLREPIENALAMVQNRLAMHGIALEVGWEEPLPEVLVSPEQMEQVFLNLFLNAADAMEGQGGRLEVHGWEEGGEVWVAVHDTGPGIPEEIRDKIFEPFVTTKEHSSGLGLWVTYGIVHEHGGRIDVESEAGKGTTFTVRLPALRTQGSTRGARTS
ncbi:MAG: ATP-binding protein [Chloroflexia bacterium]